MKTNINKEIKNKRKSNFKKILGSSLALLVLLGGAGVSAAVMNSVDEEVSENVANEGIKLKPVRKVENADGSVTQTITYEVQPSGATDKSVSVKIMDEDSNVITSTDIIEVSVSSANQEISVTIKQAFDKKLYVNVYSNYDNDIYATLAIDYEKKLLSMGDGVIINEPAIDNSYVFSVDKFFTPTYSKYTLDKTYTYSISEVEVTLDYSVSDPDCFPFKDSSASVLNDLIEASILDGTALTDTELWNALDNAGYTEEEINDWHSYLYESNFSMYFDVNYRITCNETGLSTEFDGCGNLMLDRDYTGLVVGVNGLELETEGLVF